MMRMGRGGRAEGPPGPGGAGGQGMPMDGQSMVQLLESMGVKRYEPRVINQLLEFAHKYSNDVLTDGLSYARHAGREAVDITDVRLAIDTKLADSFTHPPPREEVMRLARKRNQSALPLLPNELGIRLPPEKYRLTVPNQHYGPTNAALRNAASTSTAASMIRPVGSGGGSKALGKRKGVHEIAIKLKDQDGDVEEEDSESGDEDNEWG